jgi:hypothetical protein
MKRLALCLTSESKFTRPSSIITKMRTAHSFYPIFLSAALAMPAMFDIRQNNPPTSPDILVEYKDEWGNATGYTVMLKDFTGCDRPVDDCNKPVPRGLRKELISSGLDDMIRMMPVTIINTPDLDGGIFPTVEYVIDWNSAAAIEFLGSNARSGSYRPAMQSKYHRLLFIIDIVTGVANSRLSENFNKLGGTERGRFVGVEVHVRCDDPANAVSTSDGPGMP